MSTELSATTVAKAARIIRRHLEQRNDPPKRAVPKPRPTGKKEEAFSDVQE